MFGEGGDWAKGRGLSAVNGFGERIERITTASNIRVIRSCNLLTASYTTSTQQHRSRNERIVIRQFRDPCYPATPPTAAAPSPHADFQAARKF